MGTDGQDREAAADSRRPDGVVVSRREVLLGGSTVLAGGAAVVFALDDDGTDGGRPRTRRRRTATVGRRRGPRPASRRRRGRAGRHSESLRRLEQRDDRIDAQAERIEVLESKTSGWKPKTRSYGRDWTPSKTSSRRWRQNVPTRRLARSERPVWTRDGRVMSAPPASGRYVHSVRI